MKGDGKMTNEELCKRLSAISSGDKAAFEEIYSEIRTPAFTVAYRITQDRHLAEDILQDFFVRLYRNPPETPLKNARAYMMRTVHNLAVDALRKNPRNADIDDYENISADCGSPDERLDINGALKGLSDEERRIVVLHVNGGLKFREIAETEGMPLGTVLWKYRRAIGRLRDILNGY